MAHIHNLPFFLALNPFKVYYKSVKSRYLLSLKYNKINKSHQLVDHKSVLRSCGKQEKKSNAICKIYMQYYIIVHS